MLKDKFLSEHAPNILQTIETTKNLVAYLKRSGLVSRLPNTVHQETDTRWNSRIEMLRSVLTQYDEIWEILREAQETNRLENYNKHKARDLIDFLELFEEAILVLEGEKKPTLHLVTLWFHKLLQHCEPNTMDNKEIKNVKNAVKNYLETKFHLHDLQKIATFLVPTFRKLRMLTIAEKTLVHEKITKLISEIPNQQTIDQPGTSASSTISDNEEVQPKRLRTVFHEWADSDEETENDDISSYMALKHTDIVDILQWWKDNNHLLPNLNLIAKKVFAIPATSASSERCFSSAGFLIQERRSRLKPELVDAILFLHNNT